MTIRPATRDDLPELRAMFDEFCAEVPPPAFRTVDLEHEWSEVEEMVENDVTLVAEEDGHPIGFALAKLSSTGPGHVTDVFVRPNARGSGAARELMREAGARLRQRGARVVTLDVQWGNARARRFYERLGFQPEQVRLWVDADELERRAAEERPHEVYGAVHVQTDDRPRVEDAVARYVPRLGHSEGHEVSDPHNGWISVVDELCSREPQLLQRLARELSNRLAVVSVALGVEEEVVRYAIYEHGRSLDEYLSVPEYFGELPPGDVVALGANPTVVARLTGADPGRVREVVRTAASPAELPPAPELYRRIADVMGLTLPG